jgi:hypothetical protein
LQQAAWGLVQSSANARGFDSNRPLNATPSVRLQLALALLFFFLLKKAKTNRNRNTAHGTQRKGICE